MNGASSYTQPAPDQATPPRDRRAVTVSIVAGFVLLVALLTFLFFAGVIRIGTPGVSSLTMASKIDSRQRPAVKKSRFDGSEKRIYCCARVRAFEDTVLEARWYRGNAQVGGITGTFGALTRSSGGRLSPSRGNIAFYLDRPPSGWVSGSYQVRVYLNRKRGRDAGFTITTRGQDSGAGVYRDPGGLFSVKVPDGWVEADPSTLQGDLAGFTATTGEYPPRFVVAETDFTGVDPAYLNGSVNQGGQQASGQFQPYSFGDNPGARRDFLWDYKDGGKTYKLHSVQAVVQGKDGKVFSVNCHSLATEYDRNLPVFNSIINSFSPGS
jgi:hypothetical protein